MAPRSSALRLADMIEASGLIREEMAGVTLAAGGDGSPPT